MGGVYGTHQARLLGFWRLLMTRAVRSMHARPSSSAIATGISSLQLQLATCHNFRKIQHGSGVRAHRLRAVTAWCAPCLPRVLTPEGCVTR